MSDPTKKKKVGGRRPGAGRKKSEIPKTQLFIWIPTAVKEVLYEIATAKNISASKMCAQILERWAERRRPTNQEESNDVK